MLMEFKTKNYKLFKEEIIFNMTAADKIHDIEYSVTKKKLGKKIEKILSSAVIYGPNAAGKTNLIGAIEVMKAIVINGNIRNSNVNDKLPNEAKSRLEIIPNIASTEKEPVEFSIRFLKNDEVFDYSFSLLLGKFMDVDYSRKVISEKLFLNNKMIFERNDDIIFGKDSVLFPYLIEGYNKKVSHNVAKKNINDEELFLTSTFKVLFSSKLTNMIIDWFENDLFVIYKSNDLYIEPVIKEGMENNKVYCIKNLLDAMKEFGLTGNSFGYTKRKDESHIELFSLIHDGNHSKDLAIPSIVYESYGTIRFMNIFPLIADALRKGQTIIIDEFDASIHPMAIMSLINIFHNDDINKKSAQLIFNTHNAIFLNRNLFRRDEIKFVERDKETGVSIHYSLSDFGTSGEGGVRNTTDYMKHYFMGRYGAISDVDFSDVFTKLMEDEGNCDD